MNTTQFDDSMAWARMLKILPRAIVVINSDRAISHVGDAMAGLLGYQPYELKGEMLDVIIPERYRAAHAAFVSEFSRKLRADERTNEIRLSLSHRSGVELEVRVSVLAIALDGKPWVIAALIEDGASSETADVHHAVTRAKLVTAAALAESEERFRHAFHDNTSPMVFLDLQDQVIATNDAFCNMVGRTPEEIVGLDATPFTFPGDVGITEDASLRLLKSSLDSVRYVKRYLHKDGHVVVAEISKYRARNAAGETIYFVVSERDITEERALAEQLSHQALHDPLTGLANRALFEDRLSQADVRMTRQGEQGAVLLLDLDGFKDVNDNYGHLVGDQLLVGIAHRLAEVTRSADTLCRFGGDEFLYLTEGVASSAQAQVVADRLQAVFTEPFELPGVNLVQRASIGVVLWDPAVTDHSHIVQQADAAMYQAKRSAKGQHVLFESTMQPTGPDVTALSEELRLAIEAGHVSMHYQPIFELTTSKVVGCEALMRWDHPTRGMVPPSVFLSLAEQSELIVALGQLALRQAIATAATWEPMDGERPNYVTVNLSARQFHDPELVSTIVDALMSSGLAPERLILEITEGVTLLDVAATLGVVDRLNRLGIGVALDDFGTGYSSLSYLTLLHPKIIKIDRSFVSPTHQSLYNDTLLETIVSLGQKLSVLVLAEGIETSAQLDRLRDIGCDLGQGFLYSPAVPASELPALLHQTYVN